MREKILLLGLYEVLGEELVGFSALLYVSEDPEVSCPCFDGK